MMPFMTQPAVAPACYVPRAGSAIGQSQIMGDSRALLRSPAVAGNGRRGTLHGFIGAAASAVIIEAGTDQSNRTSLFWDAGSLYVYHVVNDDQRFYRATAPLFRDYSRLYELHLIWDLPTVRLFVGGVEVTSWIASPNINALTAADSLFFGQAVPHTIGRNVYNTIGYLSARVSDLRMVDGAVLLPDAMGELNIHGVRVPKPLPEIESAIAAAGGYGVTGWHLDFALPLDPGHDASGKGNHFTAVGFDATGKDTVSSSPTNVYATLNPLRSQYGNLGRGGFSNGNLTYRSGDNNADGLMPYATLPVISGSADVRMEVRIDRANGNASEGTRVRIGLSGPRGSLLLRDDGGVSCDGECALVSGAGFRMGSGDTITFAVRPSRGVIDVYNAGTLACSFRIFDLAWVYGCVVGANGDYSQHTWNFGQKPWSVTIPALAGVKGLCTDNLPEPEIKDPGEAFAQVVTTGAGMDAALNALAAHWNGAPYVEIVKRRDASEDWRVRFSDDPTNAWATNNANAKASTPALAAAGNYVGYRLRVGARYGVWTAEVDHVNGTATTVSHGLNTARAVVIATRVSAGGGDRFVWHPDLPNGQLLKLNSIAGAAADSSLGAFGVNSFQLAAALPSGTYRVLVLAERVGFLSLSKHIGNGILNGPMVPMDILPLFSITKRCTNIPSNANGWQVHDAARDSGNGLVTRLWVNIPDSDHPTVAQVDFVVGGLKWRDYAIDVNASGETFINIAIGRPIGGVCVAPATAR